ncbi:target of Nesh-SH3 isoform X2 [Anguilla anguilla]|uniref:target of Nesh-SH3 isoform X2 n=1 Tax=Anguilla anguilla TaxID=7936 RepID=UPI0015B21EF7|nr:target of Nesh-SH3 isoform X2 [Anguilla anguilla]
MFFRSALLLLAGIVLTECRSPPRIRVRRQNMKVRINATGDTIILKFVKPNPDVKLEGYILGYGSSMFSKQFIPLPENGKPYETEMDAEPKYLIAVQPIPSNDVKKHCTGKVDLEKPLHLVIGSVTPTSVLLSWGTLLKTPYDGNIMNDCLEDGHYTVRYRERNRKWNYQTCPTSDTVIDNLKPNTPYEFGVRSNKEEKSGVWSKPLIHNTNMGEKGIQKLFKPKIPNGKPVSIMTGSRVMFPPRLAVHNRTHSRGSHVLQNIAFPGSPRSTFAPPESRPEISPVPRPNAPQMSQLTLGSVNKDRNVFSPSEDIPLANPQPLPTKPLSTTTAIPVTIPQQGQQAQPQASSTTQRPIKSLVFGESRNGYSPLRPAYTTEKASSHDWGKGILKNQGPTKPHVSQGSVVAMPARNLTSSGRDFIFPSRYGIRPHILSRVTNSSRTLMIRGANGEHHKGLNFPKPLMKSRFRWGSSPQRPPPPMKTNLVDKPGDKDKTSDLKQTDKASILRPNFSSVTAKPAKQDRKQTTTAAPTLNETQFDTWENSSLFSSIPSSEVDAMGKKRFVAPHVIYKTDKKPNEPCSITTSLNYFPEDEAGEQNVTGPPRTPPSNLTVVTVEGCPSFVILGWQKTDNETTGYEVISTTKGPDGEEVSILTTNQTHTAVENLKPERSYEFSVKPVNPLGSGPPTEPVEFNTESADPRVSENVSGKDAIWTQFPFKSDGYSECNGKQYVKRTWYRKFVGIQLCNSLRYKIYLSDSLTGKFYNIGDQTGHGEDHCQFVDSFLDGRTGTQFRADQLPPKTGYYRAMRQEPVSFGEIGGNSHISYVAWYECGTPIPGKW